MAEKDIELILKQYNLTFITYEIHLEFYTTGDIMAYIDGISKGGFKIEHDNLTMKIHLFGRSNFVSFLEKSFISTF